MSKLVEFGVEMIGYLKKGDVFIVKDLFPSFCWDSMSLNERKVLGMDFFRYLETNKNLNIKILDKTILNQQKYQKL